MFRIASMDCSSEEAEIRRAVDAIPGIRALRFQLSARTLGIQATEQALRQALQAIRKHVVFLLLEVARLKTVALSRAQYPSVVRSVYASGEHMLTRSQHAGFSFSRAPSDAAATR